jgi:hypothetical protein
VPYTVSEEIRLQYLQYTEQLGHVLGKGEHGTAIELFMRLAGSSDEGIAAARNSPMWPGLEALAPTLAYDAACLGDGRPPSDRLARITQPTLVLTGGGTDPHTGGLQPGFFDEAADAITTMIPKAERRIIEGQSHVADADALTSVLERFFNH